MPKRGHVFLTLRDMRIAKIDRKVIAKPCTDEFNNYIQALARIRHDDDGIVPKEISFALTDCMEMLGKGQQQISLKYHLQKFLKSQK